MNIVVLTGAGISAESGINTFRGQEGLWENHRIEDVASPQGFRRNPDLVHRFYNDRRRQLLNPAIKPNHGHQALKNLEVVPEVQFLLVTQNVDNLHEAAGSLNVCHMHGELLKVRCQSSGQILNWHQDTQTTTPCPCCNQPGNLRPHIVWFGEQPFFMDEILTALSQADVFAAIGTSGQVYPAAGFVEYARSHGARCYEINPEPTGNHLFHEVLAAPASTGVSEFVAKITKTPPPASS